MIRIYSELNRKESYRQVEVRDIVVLFNFAKLFLVILSRNKILPKSDTFFDLHLQNILSLIVSDFIFPLIRVDISSSFNSNLVRLSVELPRDNTLGHPNPDNQNLMFELSFKILRLFNKSCSRVFNSGVYRVQKAIRDSIVTDTRYLYNIFNSLKYRSAVVDHF